MNTPNVKLTTLVRCAGCAAKLNARALGELLHGLPPGLRENLLVGIETSDDAGVYRLTDDLALVQTVDFFPPIVDDPYTFGQIAAANALSDIYAMGGKPLTGLNIAAFPTKGVSPSVLVDILRGGLDKLTEAGAALVGGHTIQDEEIKYGVAVTGVVHPSKVVTNAAAQPGDVLVLTKRLGTGLIASAAKAEMVSAETLAEAIESMRTLNRAAAEAMCEVGVHAATDVTGFGLIGHASQMALASGVSFIVGSQRVPLFEAAPQLADMGLLPSGSHANRESFGTRAEIAPNVPRGVADVLFDAQTSGGLLIAVSADKEAALVSALARRAVAVRAVIGRVQAGQAGVVRVV